MKDCFLGIYWSKRGETIDQCAQKVLETLNFLSEFDTSFTDWYHTSKPKKGQTALIIPRNYFALKNFLFDGRNYKDDGTLNDDLGYTISMKSFKDYSTSHVFSTTCGCYNDLIANSVVLNISKTDEYNYLIDRSQLFPIYRKFVEIWSPERGVIKCHDNDVPMLSEFYN